MCPKIGNPFCRVSVNDDSILGSERVLAPFMEISHVETATAALRPRGIFETPGNVQWTGIHHPKRDGNTTDEGACQSNSLVIILILPVLVIVKDSESPSEKHRSDLMKGNDS